MTRQMASWRLRGYVPDSDQEEDDEESIEEEVDQRVGIFDDVHRSKPSQTSAVIDRTKHVEIGVNAPSRNEGSRRPQEIKAVEVRIEQRKASQVETVGHRSGDGLCETVPCIDEEIDELQDPLYDQETLKSANPSAVRQGKGAQVARFNPQQVQHDIAEVDVAAQVQAGVEEKTNKTQEDPSSLSSGPRSPVKTDFELRSTNSSPLSDPPSSSEVQNDVETFSVYDMQREREGTLPLEGVSEQIEVAHDASTPPSFSDRGRNLRERKAIQLHPYLIESEKYRKAFHERGIRALRFARQESQVPAEDDSQAQEFSASQVSRSSSMAPESAIGSQGERVASVDDVMEEFPDMETLLNQQDTQFMPIGHKRQRLDRPRFKHPKGHVRQQNQERQRNDSGTRNETNYVRTLPSPPVSIASSESSEGPTRAPSSRRPLSGTPAALPTPVISSGPRVDAVIDTWDVESTDSETLDDYDNRDPLNNSDRRSPLAHDPYERVKNRIKGVLPASWLRLDLRAQTSKLPQPPSKQLSPSPLKTSPVRGVAQHIPRRKYSQTRSPARGSHVFIVSDDEASDIGANDNDAPTEHQETSVLDFDDHSVVDTTRWGEAEETEEIDAMLTTSSRVFRKRKSRKRQTRISDFNQQDSTTRLSRKRTHNGGTSMAAWQAKAARARPRPPKSRVPKLSLLDVLPVAENTVQETQPSFLKIASRTAKRRRDKGRHSPSHKYLRLPTHQDTLDANENLRRWRCGDIAPASIQANSSQHSRQPLLPISANVMPSAMSLEGHDSLHYTAEPKPSRHSIAAPARKLQTTLNKVSPAMRTLERPTSLHSRRANHVPESLVQKNSRGLLQTSMQLPKDLRPAMLETSQDQANGLDSRHLLTRHVLSDRESKLFAQPFRIAWNQQRSLDLASREPGAILGPSVQPEGNMIRPAKAGAEAARGRISRKRHPHRIDLSMTWQDELDIHESPPPVELPPHHGSTTLLSRQDSTTSSKQRMIGLGPYGTSYTTCFDVVPFTPGIHFHASTFLGSGQFKACLDLNTRLFDRPRQNAVFAVTGRTFSWGAWNEELSSSMSSLCEEALNLRRQSSSLAGLQMQSDLMRHCAQHLSNHLYFYDPVDRAAYVAKALSVVNAMMSADINLSSERHDNDELSRDGSKKAHVQLKSFCAIFAYQLHQLAQFSGLPEPVVSEAWSILSEAHKNLRKMVIDNITDLERLAHKFRNSSDAGSVLEEDVAEAFVFSQHILSRNGQLSKVDQQVCADRFLAMAGKEDHHVANLEKAWRAIFQIQPFIEFDESGVLEVGRRFRVDCDNWMALKAIVTPVLDTYRANERGQPATFNAYCRAIFNRCLYLMNSWGWYRCDTIISTFFDFFSSNKLYNLSHEDCHGSPRFLEILSDTLSLAPAAEDRCFHIFLKIIGAGVRHLAAAYPEKKLGNMVWRLLPNHGRSHPKEESVRHEDLDALRNHHDLLCTLYWAAPTKLRPKLSTIRRLVDVETSHRQAIHISIKAWKNLLTYQMKTSESVDNLKAFVEWFNELLHQILRQHALARSEAEDQVRSAQHLQGVHVSNHILESTISNNQRQIEALVSDLLTSLRATIDGAPTRSAVDLVFASSFTSVFNIFNSHQPHTCRPVIDALDVVDSYVLRLTQWTSTQAFPGGDEDSQEFGDWSDVVADAMDIDAGPATASHVADIHDALHYLLSNCFGADQAPTDDLLRKVVDIWVAVGQNLVKAGSKSWSDYIGTRHRDSWVSLRNTDQKRKYTAYYLARLLDREPSIYLHERAFFLRFFMESLIERESLLKHQHVLISALLNLRLDDPILTNLPFYVTASGHQYEITAREFSERRLSVISSLLANMRGSLMSASWEQASFAVERKQEYKEMLNHMMHKMKDNFRELGPASTASGAYVDFVHHVIGMLQQYTTSICPVHAFFTEDASFPLPAADPTYVVSRLKDYELRIQDSRAQKELITFIQSTAERAAVDNHQSYLADQIYNATSPAFEKGACDLTLRTFLLSCVFPAYAGTAFKSECGWILCLPFLRAFMRDFDGMLLHLDGCSTASVGAVSSNTTSFLTATLNALLVVCYQPSLLRQASCLKTIRAFYDAAHALFPTLQYLKRLGGPIDESLRCMSDITTFAQDVLQMLSSTKSDSDIYLQRLDSVRIMSHLPTIGEFAAIELKQTLDRSWTRVNRTYFVKRGTGRKEILVDVGLIEEEGQELKRVLDRFVREVLPVLSDEDQDRNAVSKREPGDAWSMVKDEESLLLF